jgi:6-phosphogluconolactonase
VHLALAGGTTPKRFYEFVAGQPNGVIDWKEVHLWWGDERCVPPSDPQSNFRMVRESLLDHIDVPAENVHRIHGENDPETEARRYGNEISVLIPLSKQGLPVFDLILLGLGEDGHTASIFPDTELYERRASYCITAEHPDSGQMRISLNLPVLNSARNVLFMVSGAAKADIAAKILRDPGSSGDLPAAKVRPGSGSLSWFLDRAAAKHFPDKKMFYL